MSPCRTRSETLIHRLCPGRWLAIDSIWIAVASILTVYTIEKALSEDGVEICPSVEYTPSLIRSVFIAAVEVIDGSERYTAAQNHSSVVSCLEVKGLYTLSNRLALTQAHPIIQLRVENEISLQFNRPHLQSTPS